MNPASPGAWRSGPTARRRSALLALSAPLLILLGVLALLHRSGSDRVQAVPALLIGVGLLVTSLLRRRRRRTEMLQSLRRLRDADRGLNGAEGLPRP